MSKAKMMTAGFAVGILVLAAVWVPSQVWAEAMSGHAMHQMHSARQGSMSKPNLKMLHGHQIPALSLSLEKAILAVKAGEDAIALSELQKAQTLLETVKKAVAMQVQPTYVNTACPMMGGVIKPENVTDKLTRQFDGQTVAFCCNGCPGLWDRLTDEQKQAKLEPVKAKDAASAQHNH